MIQVIKNLLRPLIGLLRFLVLLNWSKTIYLNFKTQRIKDAVRFPILVYGRLRIMSLLGQIEIHGPIRPGLIQIGKDIDGFPQTFLPVSFYLDGRLVFKGPCIISGGTNITVWRGVLTFGRYCMLGSGSVIKCFERIDVGDMTRITTNCIVMDTNVHFIKDINTGRVVKPYHAIEIGRNCWINANTSIAKGTIIPDYCIVARNSFLSTDYSKVCGPHSLLAGSPAKLKLNAVQRVFSYEEERVLLERFLERSELTELRVASGLFIETDRALDLVFKVKI